MRKAFPGRPPGYSLVELVITMSAGSTLFVLAIGLVHQSMSHSSVTRRQAGHQRTLNRLAAQFRHDAHRASRWELQSEFEAQLLTPAGGSVSYSIEENRVIRIQRADNANDRREVYQLAESAAVTMGTLDDPPRAELTVAVPAPAFQAAAQHRRRLDRRVQAAVGRMLWLQQGRTRNAEVTP